MRRIEQATSQNVQQIQRLILSPQMQQALHLLQLPILELNTAIEEEVVNNPLLEKEEGFCSDIRGRETKNTHNREDLHHFIENTVAYEESLYEHLMAQAREVFTEDSQRERAEWLIGNFNSDGFLTSSLEEVATLGSYEIKDLIPILLILKTFHPYGVGAKNCQEALLLQLDAAGKKGTMAFQIIENHFDDLIHNKIPNIAKAFSCSPKEIRKIIIEEISKLDLHPGTNSPAGHYRQLSHNITPDLFIKHLEGNLLVEVNDQNLSNLKLNHFYLDMLNDPSVSNATRDYIYEKISSGKWLMRNLYERNKTLHRIGEELLRSQQAFLLAPKGELIPMTMKELAEKLDLHPSTIARAVSQKYVSCPRGIFPLRTFFTHTYITDHGDNISSQVIKETLIQMIDKENKHTPLSDESIAKMIQKQGIPCARRTIAKYRHELKIGNTAQRRIH
ncbi:MAG: RNA polymerase factor sigma-54 [Chlamydiales bacterium]